MSGALCVMLGGGEAVVVFVEPASSEGTGSGNVINGSAVTATPSSGTASAYSWVKISGGSILASSPSAATTGFVGAGFTGPETRVAAFACDVTVNGVTYRSPNVTVTLERF